MKIAILVCAGLLVPCVAAATPNPPEPRTVERVVAFVDDKPIWLSDLRRAALTLRRQLAALPKKDRARGKKELYEQLLARQIDRALVAKEARIWKLSVSPPEVDKAVTAVAKQNGIPTKELLAAALKEGMSEAEYRTELRYQILEAKLLNLHIRKLGIDARGPKGLKRLAAERQRWMSGLKKKSHITIRVRP